MARRHNTATVFAPLTVQGDFFGAARIVRPVHPCVEQPRTPDGRFQSPSPARRRATPRAQNITGRDRAVGQHLTATVPEKAHVVVELQRAADKAYARLRAPVSTNDVRHVLAEADYRGDPRVLSAAFPLSRWTPVGTTMYHGGPGHTRRIRTFIPREESAR